MTQPDKERQGGISDAVEVYDANGDEVTDELGIIQTSSYEINLNTTRRGDVNSGANYKTTVDGVAQYNTSLSIEAPDLKPLKLLGNYEEDTEEDTWTIEFPKRHPYNQYVRQRVVGDSSDDNQVNQFEGVKFDRAEINIEQEAPVTIDMDGMALDWEQLSNYSISPSSDDSDVLEWLEVWVEINGEEVGSIETASIIYDRDAESKRGVEKKDEGDIRNPSEIRERMKDFDVDLVVEITDNTAFEAFVEDYTSGSKSVQDENRDGVEVAIRSRRAETGDFVVEDVVFPDLDGELADNAEDRTVSLSGFGLQAHIEGEL